MKTYRALTLLGFASLFGLTSCETSDVGRAAERVAGVIDSISHGGDTRSVASLSTEEIVLGLKEALRVGTKNASNQASRANGFYNNPQLRINFPQDAIAVKNFAVNAGLGSQVSQFEQKLNAAAEQAAGKAVPIFSDAVKQMTISDALGILRGGDTAATQYFRARTAAKLKSEFRPVVDRALTNVKVAKYWTPLTSAYNLSPWSKKQVSTDLQAYVTDEAIDGLFLLLANEEREIRRNPAARVTAILKRVFGSNLAR